ncbi:MAG: hypothetical protein ISR55_02055 [Bacteroidetes bacterium]|nr:hypothetical protein [Bacteroidota bacterium]
MKNKILVITLISIFSGILLISLINCQNEITNDIALPYFSNDDSNTIDTVNVDIIYEETGTITTSNVEVDSGILHFDTRADFEIIVEEIINRSRSDIDQWESTLEFTSRYSYYNDLEDNNENIDDYDNEIIRLADPYFASILNRYDEIIVDDTLYTYDFAEKEVTLTFPDYSDTTISLQGGSFFVANFYEECGTCKTWAGPKYYNTDEKLMAYKWITNAQIYNSIGAGLKYYKKNRRNKWKRYSTSQLNLHIDQWHDVDWYFSKYPLVIHNLTYKKRKTTNKNHNQWVFPEGWTLFDEGYFCAQKFERFHCYTTGYWNDLHHDNECH